MIMGSEDEEHRGEVESDPHDCDQKRTSTTTNRSPTQGTAADGPSAVGHRTGDVEHRGSYR